MSNTLWDSRLIAEEFAAGEGMAMELAHDALRETAGVQSSVLTCLLVC